ncbi:unnamed protein product [Cuscuta epithymum]|uniref:Uncharacterized protein n=1 Tax=Cuscuta epithymum TaxID=186058 RepID=A0AAV0CAC8_9ASTE|nr:unnamed protein product [Cuscuta epithymum]
MDDQKLCR